LPNLNGLVKRNLNGNDYSRAIDFSCYDGHIDQYGNDDSKTIELIKTYTGEIVE